MAKKNNNKKDRSDVKKEAVEDINETVEDLEEDDDLTVTEEIDAKPVKSNKKEAAKSSSKKDSVKESKKSGFFQKVKKYFRDTASEFRKIVWPSRKTVVNNTLVVLTMVVIFAVLVFALDYGFSKGRDLLIDAVVKMASGGGA